MKSQKTFRRKEVGTEKKIETVETSPWLGEIQNALAPYWSARVVRRPNGQGPVLEIDGLKNGRGNHHAL